MSDDGCICKGNWRLIISECRDLLGRKYREDRTGHEYTFYGVVHGDDDYYYGMYRHGEARLLSCVGSIEGFGFTLIPKGERREIAERRTGHASKSMWDRTERRKSARRGVPHVAKITSV